MPDPNRPRCPTTGKLRYRSMEQAEKALAEVVLRGSSRQTACRVYRCPDCDGWHLTSQPRREK